MDAAPASPSSWEQFLGVRAAAGLGAAVLALAGLYFFRFSIEHGLLTPPLRVVLGTAVGLGCLVWSEARLKDRHRVLADFLAGAGTALLYFAFWSASALYHLVPAGVAFVLMALVTAVSCFLSISRRSVPIAALGLLGGFATPVLLSTGADRPLELFSYLLLLDLGVLALARRQRWPWLAALALAGTTLYQAAWILGRMGSGRLVLGMAILAVFATAFVALTEERDEGSRETGRAVRAAALLVPFAFALRFASDGALTPTLLHLGPFLLLLTVASAHLAERHAQPSLAIAASGAALAITAAHALHRGPGGALDAPLVGLLAADALVFAALLARGRAPDQRTELAVAAGISTLGGLALIGSLGFARASSLPASVLGLFLLAALGLAQARPSSRAWTHVPISLVLALSLGLWPFAHRGASGLLEAPTYLALALLGAVGLAIAARLTPPSSAVWARHGAALGALVLVLTLGVLPSPVALEGGWLLVTIGGFTALVLLAAARAETSGWAVAAVVGAFLACVTWAFASHDGEAQRVLALELVLVVPLGLAPLLAAPLCSHAWAWRAAALAPLLWLLPTRRLVLAGFGDHALGLLPVGLSLLPLAGAAYARAALSGAPALRRSALVAMAASSLALLSIAIPMQLSKEWLTVGWALQAAAVLVLYRRTGHAGLRWLGLALYAVVAVRLLLNPSVFGYHARAGLPIFNWLAYTYLIPAASMVLGAQLLRAHHLEGDAGAGGPTPAVARDVAALVVVAVAVGFAWITLAIVDAFSTERWLTLSLERRPARDLTLSVAWALYALGLLGLGVWKTVRGLRVLSLALLTVTAAKVFLYDLGRLTDLYRVGSLLGLSMALIALSLAYRRYVFTTEEGALR